VSSFHHTLQPFLNIDFIPLACVLIFDPLHPVNCTYRPNDLLNNNNNNNNNNYSLLLCGMNSQMGNCRKGTT
jgi:hypothetical protein